MWIVATSDVMKFTIVCQKWSGMQGEVVVHPHLGVIRLNMTCRAANGFCVYPYIMRKGKRSYSGCLGFTFEIEMYSTLFSFGKFYI